MDRKEIPPEVLVKLCLKLRLPLMYENKVPRAGGGCEVWPVIEVRGIPSTAQAQRLQNYVPSRQGVVTGREVSSLGP